MWSSSSSTGSNSISINTSNINTSSTTSNSMLKDVKNMKEEEIASLEQETMMKELRHLLYDIVPQQWSKIINEIQQAVGLLGGEVKHLQSMENNSNNNSNNNNQQPTSTIASSSDQQQDNPKDEPQTPSTPGIPATPTKFNATNSFRAKNNAERIQLHINDQNHAILKGYLLVDGYRILGGKINFKLHKMKQSCEAEIRPNDPYTLSQIQRAHHMADYALNKMKNIDIEKYSENSNIVLEGDDEVDLMNSTYLSKTTSKIERDVTTILTILERVMILVQQGREQLTTYGGLRFLTDEYRLSSSISEKANIELLQQSFHPRLPKETLIEFSITNAQLHVGVYGLSYTSIATSSVTQLKNSNLSSDSRHRHFITEDNEIGYFSEEYISKITVASFSSGLDHLTNAFKMCSRLRNLLTTHGLY